MSVTVYPLSSSIGFVKALNLLVIILLVAGCTTNKIGKSNHRTSICAEFIYYSENYVKNSPLILSFWGTGIYTRGGKRFSSSFSNSFEEGKISILAIDKPGIQYSIVEDNYRIDFHKFSRFTQGDLINCAEISLRKVVKTLNPQEIFFKGHSEGAETLTRLYKKLLIEDEKLASKVTKLIFSGVSLVGWKAEMKRQFATMYPKGFSERLFPRFMKAVEENDNDFLIANGAVNSFYLRDIFKSKSMEDEFKELAGIGPKAQFYFFQGNKDKNTPVEYVKKFEKWNSRQPSSKRLNLSVRYYDADHSLNKEASADIRKILIGE